MRTSGSKSQGSSIKNYPYLTPEEFTEACHHLDSQYCRATLGPVRKQWRLRAVMALNTSSFTMLGLDYHTYIQIIRPLEDTSSGRDDEDLSRYLDKFSFGGDDRLNSGDAGDKEMIEVEEADDEAIYPTTQPPKYNPGYVRYEIHLHPTYQVPCLWFSLHDLPLDEPALNIDTVFRRLVPDQYKDGLRSAVGSIGGISADHHPITGLPSFFIHPCLLGDAMSNFECSRETYLMVWLGLVGGCVGLWVPKEMALDSPTS
ncbi:hypothetical protein V8F20_012678 [Naviculisporaceae sp. PSN 640]